MQPTNSTTNKSNQRTVAIGFAVIIVAAIVIIALISRSSNSNNSQETTQTTTSGVINEADLADNAGPNYDALIDKGFSDRHIDALQYALFQFAQPTGISVKNTTIPKEGVTHIVSDPDNGVFYHTYNFTVKFDDKNSFKAKAEVSGLSGLRLYVYNPTTNALVYDSKQLDAKTIN